MAKGKHAPAPGAVRNDKVVHPNSRKAAKAQSRAGRYAKVKDKPKAGAARLQALGEKLAWFRDNLPLCLEENQHQATLADVQTLAETYLDRFREELEQIKIKNNVGKSSRRKLQHASRLAVIEHASKLEREEWLGCGIEMPDLLDEDNLKYLREWSGELRFVQNLKVRRVSKKWLEKQKDLVKNDNEMDTSS